MGLFSDIGGSILQFIGGERANRATAKMVHDQMDFQQYMSNTSHQREVKDLIAAGLNPILSATGGSGASTPSGASANMENTLGPAVNTALQARRLRQEIKNMEVDYEVSTNQARLLDEQRRKTAAEGSILDQELEGAKVEGDLDSKPLGELFEGGWRNTSVGEITRLINRIFGGGSSASNLFRLFGR